MNLPVVILWLNHCALLLRCAVWLIACAAPATVFSQLQIQHWDYAAYRMDVRVAIDAPGQLREKLERELPEIIRQRADTSIGPVWKLELSNADSVLRNQMLRDLQGTKLAATTLDQATGEVMPVDKLTLLVVQANGSGFHLQARQYDGYLQRWGTVAGDSCQQYSALGERSFQLLHECFAPLAKLRIDPENEDLVQLTPRASKIAIKDPTISWFRQNDVFLPMLRRTTRDGQLIENAIQVVPWTYAVAERVRDELIVARLYSGTKRPLGVRRRGRVEQLAIALRGKPAPIVLNLHARSDSRKPLEGYEVYSQDTDAEALNLAGWTNRQGQFTLPPGRTPVQLLWLKNGGQLLARLPVVPGAEPVVEIPLPDDGPRLRAEAALNALRENLIDLVARRNILIARTRNLIDEGDLGRAKQLFDQLDELPGRAQFNRALSKQEQLFHSPDPQIQRRINRLFATTREVLGQFLDIREISELRDELESARVASTP